MGAAESTSRTNGTNQEEEEHKQNSNTVAGAAATIAAVGKAAWGISKMLSDNTDTQENESAMKMKMKTEPSYVVEQSFQTIAKRTWSPPALGRLKMNTDGGHRPNEHYAGSGIESANLRPSGYGGILRDHNGKWIRGFIGYIDVTDSLKAEFHGIHKGLVLLNKLGLKGVILETDCQAAFQWVTRRDDDWGKKKSIRDSWDIIMECRELADKNKITIELIDGDVNKCADGLAKIAIKKQVTYQELIVLPDEIRHLVIDDAKFDRRHSSTVAGAAATIAALGVAAWGISRMLSDNTDTQESESAMKMKMKTEPSYVVHQSSQTSIKKTWSPPPPGLLKMNTDGGHRPNEHYVGLGIDSANLRPSGFGGILRDHNGKWIRGFIGYIDVTDSLKAELHGIHKGLVLLNKLGLKGVILETDCQAAYQWVKRRDNKWGKKKNIHEYQKIIKECRELVDKNKITIELIDGDANKCADGLANIAIRKQVKYEELMDPPNEMIYHLVSEDAKLKLR